MLKLKKLLERTNHLNQLERDLLLAHAVRQSKEFLYTHADYRPRLLEQIRFWYFLFQFRRGYSVAAITRHKEFYGLNFYVNKHTLVPRPETELMVDEVIKIIQSHQTTLIDIGTGSGCIPVAIIKTLKQSALDRKNIKTIAIDISRKALRVARRNAKEHAVPITFLHGNLLQPIIQNSRFQNPDSSLIITANLPYLTTEQFKSEPSIQKEPYHALVADNQGLALYEKLLQQINSLLLHVPCSMFLFFEIDPSQSQKITGLIQKYLPQASIEIKKDLAGRDRLVIIKNSNS